MAGPPSDDNIQGKTKLRSAWAQGSMEQNRLVPDRTRTSKNLKSRSGPDPAQKKISKPGTGSGPRKLTKPWIGPGPRRIPKCRTEPHQAARGSLNGLRNSLETFESKTGDRRSFLNINSF